jgi:hypothetical protein
MTGTAALVPALAARVQPGYPLIAGVGLVMIAISSGFLAVARHVLGRGAAWVGLALLTNGLVMAVRSLLDPGFLPVVAVLIVAFDAMAIGVIALSQRSGAGRTPINVGKALVNAASTGCLGMLVAGAAIAFVIGLVVVETGVLDATQTALVAVASAAVTMLVAAGAMWGATRTTFSLRRAAVLATVAWLTVALLAGSGRCLRIET